MKKRIIVLFMFCLSVVLFAQVKQPLDGFWGIKWNSDIKTAEKAVQNKGKHTLIEKSNARLLYSGMFGGEEAIIAFFFDDDKFYLAQVTYPYEENRALAKYLRIKSLITEKYGPPEDDVMCFLPPYRLGDGYEELARKMNKAILTACWYFSDNNEVFIDLDSNLEVRLYYKNSEIHDKLLKEVQEKNMSDF